MFLCTPGWNICMYAIFIPIPLKLLLDTHTHTHGCIVEDIADNVHSQNVYSASGSSLLCLRVILSLTPVACSLAQEEAQAPGVKSPSQDVEPRG